MGRIWKERGASGSLGETRAGATCFPAAEGYAHPVLESEDVRVSLNNHVTIFESPPAHLRSPLGACQHLHCHHFPSRTAAGAPVPRTEPLGELSAECEAGRMRLSLLICKMGKSTLGSLPGVPPTPTDSAISPGSWEDQEGWKGGDDPCLSGGLAAVTARPPAPSVKWDVQPSAAGGAV